MGKAATGLMAALLVIVLGTAVLAQGLQKMTGTVTGIDVASRSVTVQPQEGTAITIVMQDGDKLSKIRVGVRAEVRYRVKDGRNVGVWLHNLDDEGCS